MSKQRILIAIAAICFSTPVYGANELARRASWSAPTYEATKRQVAEWFSTESPTTEQLNEFEAIWELPESVVRVTPDRQLTAIVRSLALINRSVEQLVDSLQSPERRLPDFDLAVLEDETLPDWAKSNIRLWYAQWLANHQFYNELRDQIESLKTSDVADPAALLFYQSVAFHRLLDKDNCLPALDKLLENEATIPKRYATLAKLMKADIAPMKKDSLDEVARLMDSIKVRLGQGRAGTRVRKEEDDVIAKLDKMIEQLEEQAQQSSSQSSGGQGNPAPSSPMEQSTPAELKGPGNVDPKKLGAQTDWGNLPAKEREEALQELGKDLPSHYRDVIEEYFQKLARDGVQP